MQVACQPGKARRESGIAGGKGSRRLGVDVGGTLAVEFRVDGRLPIWTTHPDAAVLRLNKSSGIATGEIEFDSVAGRIADEKLQLVRAWNRGSPIFNAGSLQPLLECRCPRAGEGYVIEGTVSPTRHQAGGRVLDQVQHRLLAKVQPMPGKRERWPPAFGHADDVDIEIAQAPGQGGIGAKVEMVE